MDDTEVRDIAVYRVEFPEPNTEWCYACSADDCFTLDERFSTPEAAITAAVAHWRSEHPEDQLNLSVEPLTLSE